MIKEKKEAMFWSLIGLALAVGVATGLVVANLMGGEEILEITFTIDEDHSGKILVDPADPKAIKHGHVVSFKNMTGLAVTVDFSAGNQGSPFYGDESFEIPAGDSGEGYTEPESIKVDPDHETDYVYSVTADDGSAETEQSAQSPRIRVGPKKD